MKAIIIEDEKAAVRNLTSLLGEVCPQIEIVTELDSIADTIEWFTDHSMPDLVFMDIHLADGSAFEIFEHVHITCPIIFTTAYDEYALRAFKVNSIDYLLKPIDNIRLEEAIVKFEHLTTKYLNQGQKPIDLMEILQNITQPGKKYRTRFLISGDDKLFTLQVEDIAYFYSENKVTFAVTKQNREFIIDLSLDKLMEQLDPDVFFRSNRQTVVSINAIVKVESYFLGKAILHVKPPFKDKIIVSRDKIAPLKLWLNY